MNASLFWLVLKALITLIPMVIQAVREGRIRAATQEELTNAILSVHTSRVARARRARDGVDLDGGDLSNDPYNRDNSSPDGR